MKRNSLCLPQRVSALRLVFLRSRVWALLRMYMYMKSYRHTNGLHYYEYTEANTSMILSMCRLRRDVPTRHLPFLRIELYVNVWFNLRDEHPISSNLSQGCPKFANNVSKTLRGGISIDVVGTSGHLELSMNSRWEGQNEQTLFWDLHYYAMYSQVHLK